MVEIAVPAMIDAQWLQTKAEPDMCHPAARPSSDKSDDCAIGEIDSFKSETNNRQHFGQATLFEGVSR